MNQRKFETRGRPRWTAAPPPRRRLLDLAGLFQLDSIATDPALGSNSPPRISVKFGGGNRYGLSVDSVTHLKCNA
jgi:hypothetical protein